MATTRTTATKQEIEKRMNELYRRSKAELKEKVQLRHMSCDLRNASKDELVSMLLASAFGRNYDQILFG